MAPNRLRDNELTQNVWENPDSDCTHRELADRLAAKLDEISRLEEEIRQMKRSHRYDT